MKQYNDHKMAKVSAENDPANDDMSEDNDMDFDPHVALEQNIQLSSSKEDEDEAQAASRSRSKKQKKTKKEGQQLHNDLRSQNGSAKSFPKNPFDNTLGTAVNDKDTYDTYAVFCDESGFFYNAAGDFLDANWDMDKGTYTLRNGNDIVLKAYPDSFSNYTPEGGSNDGILRLKSTFDHWEVGYIKCLESHIKLSPRSHAQRACTQTASKPLFWNPQKLWC